MGATILSPSRPNGTFKGVPGWLFIAAGSAGSMGMWPILLPARPVGSAKIVHEKWP
jgi:hypothetical protein